MSRLQLPYLEKSSVKRKKSHKTGKTTVLLIDDEKDALLLLEKYLSFENYKVLTASNAADGLKIYKKKKPPIIITDIVMPGMSGLELLQTIRKEDMETEIIVLTGHSDIQSAITALKHQASDFLQKPVDFQVLRFALKRAVERLQLKQSVREYTQSLERLIKQVDYSRNYLEAVVKNSPDALLTYDLEGTIISWNEAAEKITGFPVEEAIGHTLEDIFILEGPLLNKENIEAQETEKKDVIVQILTRNNDIRYISRNAQVIRDEKERVVGVIESFTDVTEQIRNERLLEKRYLQVQTINEISKQVARSDDLAVVSQFTAEALVKSFFESSQVMLFFYDAAQKGLVLQALAGYRIEEAHKRFPLGSVFKTRSGVIGDTYRQGKTHIIDDVKQSGLFKKGIIEGIVSEFAFPIRSKDKVIGVLNIENTHQVRLDDSDRFMLEAIVEFMSISAERIEMLNQIRGQNRKLEKQAAELRRALEQVESQKTIIEEQNQRLIKDLRKAGDFQKSLLPERLPEHKSVKFAALYVPSSQLGGDYYDVFNIDEHKTGILLADASGHGVAAAMLTAMFKMTFQKYAADIHNPAKVLTQINRDFCKVLQMGEFFTAFFAVLDRRTKTLTYANAAHPKPMLFLQEKNEVMELDTNGFLLGVMDEGITFEQKEMQLTERSRLVIFTDGVNEAANPKGKQFGTQRIEKYLLKEIHNEPSKYLAHFEKHLRRYTKAEYFDDDVSIVVADIY